MARFRDDPLTTSRVKRNRSLRRLETKRDLDPSDLRGRITRLKIQVLSSGKNIFWMLLQGERKRQIESNSVVTHVRINCRVREMKLRGRIRRSREQERASGRERGGP